jgi:hypothetical protein
VTRADRLKKALLGGVVALTSMAVLSGCSVLGQFQHVPAAERHKNIDVVKEELDYSSTGKIITKGYDTSDGVSSPSFFHAVMQGDKTFDILSTRIRALKDVDNCRVIPDKELSCYSGQVQVSVTKQPEKGNVFLELVDRYSGRDLK